MLIIDLFPSTVTTCREDHRRVPSATTAWLNLRLKKEWGEDGRTMARKRIPVLIWTLKMTFGLI